MSSETFHTNQVDKAYDLPPLPDTAEQIGSVELERQHLALTLVEKGLITEEFYQSGALDTFYSDEKTGHDMLSHTLVGDEFGGVHHLPTLLALDTPGRTVASVIHDPERPDKSMGAFRKAQKVKPSGAYQALHVEITGKDGQQFVKDRGSSMFPDEWSTQKVLESIIAVSEVEGVHDAERKSFAHEATIDDVRIRVITDEETGKIVTGCPR